jgi:hypothetical protein
MLCCSRLQLLAPTFEPKRREDPRCTRSRDATSGAPMHVKRMHGLCSLLTHILTYLQDVICMFYIEFWGFTNGPLYLGYNSVMATICVYQFVGTPSAECCS